MKKINVAKERRQEEADEFVGMRFQIAAIKRMLAHRGKAAVDADRIDMIARGNAPTLCRPENGRQYARELKFQDEEWDVLKPSKISKITDAALAQVARWLADGRRAPAWEYEDLPDA